MSKKNKIAILKEPHCLNCNYPFFQNEKFCPECGQKNKGKKITLGSFIREVFAGFFSWDAKFWRTLIPLLIQPGKVSKYYIEGKRERYSNPFRFYLTISVIFFLTIGITESYDKFKQLQNGNFSNNSRSVIDINNNTTEVDVDLDSIQDVLFKEINKQNSVEPKFIQEKIDALKTGTISKQPMININFDNLGRFDKAMKFQRKHPDLQIENALDSLQMNKTFENRFLYSRIGVLNSFFSKKGETQNFYRQILSYASIALFILLPLFTLFLRFIYLRKKFTYVEHLIFVFHTQTVFFLLFTVFYLIAYIKDTPDLLNVFLILFTLYLFIAMKTFYGQGYFKTFIKYLFANFAFFTLALVGSMIISLLTFAMY